jgi:hypothetical protein
MEDKTKKIAVIALIFGLLAISQAGAISTFSLNLIAGTGINITQSGDNYTISATGVGASDNTKVNKSGDSMVYLDTNEIHNTDYVHINGSNAVNLESGYSELIVNSGLDYKYNGLSKFSYSPGTNKLTIQIPISMNDDINMYGNNISNCGNCINQTQVNNTIALIVDNKYVNKSGDTMTGNLTLVNNSNVYLQLKSTSVNNTAIYGVSTNLYGVRGSSTNSTGVYGSSTNSTGVYGVSTNLYGVYGFSTNSNGIRGSSTNSYGVFGSSTNSDAIYGSSTNSTGVYGVSTNLYGVRGSSTNLTGVYGSSTNSTGVYGVSTNLYGVYGFSTNSNGIRGSSTNSYGIYSSSKIYVADKIYAPNLPNSPQTSALCFDSSNGNITYNSGLTTCLTSSETNKRNIVNITDSLTPSFMQLRPIRYTINNKLNYGFSAQQVNTIYPELVGKEELYSTTNYDSKTETTTRLNPYEGNITGLKYENMVAVLTKVIQEQQIKIESQQATLNNICFRNPSLCS